MTSKVELEMISCWVAKVMTNWMAVPVLTGSTVERAMMKLPAAKAVTVFMGSLVKMFWTVVKALTGFTVVMTMIKSPAAQVLIIFMATPEMMLLKAAKAMTDFMAATVPMIFPAVSATIIFMLMPMTHSMAVKDMTALMSLEQKALM